MSDILCVTNRSLCQEDFFTRLEKIAAAKPKAVILREKDLSAADYKILAVKAMAICRKHGVECILHSFPDVALALNSAALHLPLHLLKNLSDEAKANFSILGASCHSADEAVLAEKLGCTYITAGHIFDTDCKKGLPGRGTEFLQAVCHSVEIPVYAIGGINRQNIDELRKAGAAGACIMSGLMLCADVEQYLNQLK